MKGLRIVSIVAITLSVIFINVNSAPAAEPEYTLWIPAVAVGEFPSGTFTTELVVLTPDTGGQTIYTEFQFGPFGSSAATAEFTLDTNRRFLWAPENIMWDPEYFNLSGNQAGVIRISAERPFQATAVVRNQRTVQDVNQTVPVVGQSQMYTAEKVAYIYPIVKGEDTYSNVFLLNADSVDATFTVEVLDMFGAPIGNPHYVDLLTESGWSLRDIAGRFGATPPLTNGLVRVTSTSDAWYTFGSRVEPSGDNVTILPWVETQATP